MNRPCRINFHEDSATCLDHLPERCHSYIDGTSSLLAQNAFYIDFNPQVLRTRIGSKEDDPIDFPLESVSHIEWFYGNDVPSPLVPWTSSASRNSDGRKN